MPGASFRKSIRMASSCNPTALTIWLTSSCNRREIRASAASCSPMAPNKVRSKAGCETATVFFDSLSLMMHDFQWQRNKKASNCFQARLSGAVRRLLSMQDPLGGRDHILRHQAIFLHQFLGSARFCIGILDADEFDGARMGLGGDLRHPHSQSGTD